MLDEVLIKLIRVGNYRMIYTLYTRDEESDKKKIFVFSII